MQELEGRPSARMVGGYELTRRIGSGGMADVFEARHRLTARKVALKLMRTDLLGRNTAEDRFAREVKATGALTHDGVVAILDAGEHDARPFLVMEYIEGPSLREVIEKEAPLPPVRACQITLQIARALQHAHDSGVVHRDLKPENVMLGLRPDGSERVVIVDFGISRLMEDGAATGLTATGGVIGTPHYMSPEQARGETGIDGATDVYALGAVLFELLTGRKVHTGETRQAVLHHVLYHRVEALPAKCAGPFPELVPLVAHCLRKRKAQRPPLSEVVALLEHCVGPVRITSLDSSSDTMRSSAVLMQRRSLGGLWGVAAGIALGFVAGYWVSDWRARDVDAAQELDSALVSEQKDEPKPNQVEGDVMESEAAPATATANEVPTTQRTAAPPPIRSAPPERSEPRPDAPPDTTTRRAPPQPAIPKKLPSEPVTRPSQPSDPSPSSPGGFLDNPYDR